LILQELKN